MMVFGERSSVDRDGHQVQRVFSIPDFEGSGSLCTIKSVKCL